MTQLFHKSSKTSVIQIYASDKKIIIVATLNDNFTVSCGTPITIHSPFTTEELGVGVVNVMHQLPYYSKADINPNLITSLTGIRNLRRLTKEYTLLTLSWPVDDSLHLELYLGESDGSYCPTDLHKALPLNAHASTIGNCILDLLSTSTE